MPRLTLSLFGPLHIERPDAAEVRFPYDKVRALLIYLAVEADRAHRRETVAELLWPDQSGSTARHSLSQALWSLRHAIEDAASDPPALLLTRNTVQFNRASDYWLDVAAFTDLLDACDRHPHRGEETCPPCVQRLHAAVGLYRGAFLEQFSIGDSEAFEEWAGVKRELFHQRAMGALDRLIGYHERHGAYNEACRYARRQIVLDPWSESAHRRLMRLLAWSGQRGAALVQYERCRQTLADELGVEPEAETTALYERIRDGVEQRGGLAPSGPAFLPAGPPRRALPPQPTPFVGREQELAWISGLLADPVCRLLTLVGPGGIGKTRLALQVAAGQIDRFADGACFVPLVGLQSATLLGTAIADALGPPLYGQDDPEEQLLRTLQHQEVLLVLDNFEHLLDGAGLVARILAAAPGVRVLATSRERLSLHGEWVIEVEGLAVPGEDVADGVEAYDSVRLFVQSARKAQASFVLHPAHRPAVARICRLVGGMPLGIELAAAWTPVLSAEEIAREIEGGLDFLAASFRDLPARHRSVRAVFDRSWEMLAADERCAFARLSVFRGGFTRAAAEQVAEASLPILAALVSKSLIRRTAAGRYEVHELLRQYGADHLAADPAEADAVRDRHCDYYASFVADHEAALRGAEQEAALAAVSREVENVRAAWQWAVDRGRADAIARATHGVWLFAEVTGRYREQVEAFAGALAMLADGQMAGGEAGPVHALAYGRVLSHYGSCFIRIGDHEQGARAIERAIAVLRPLGRSRDLALALNFAAMYAHARQDFRREQESLEESIAGFAAAGDRWGMTYSLNDLGRATLALGDRDAAKRLVEQSLAIFTEIGDKRGQAFALRNLGVIAHRLGDDAAARQYLEQSLAIRRAIGYRWGIAEALTQLGVVARADGDAAASWDYFREALRVLIDLQAMGPALEVLTEVADLRVLHGPRDQAIDLLTAIHGHPASGPDSRERAAQALRALGAGPPQSPSSDTAIAALDRQVQALLRAEGPS